MEIWIKSMGANALGSEESFGTICDGYDSKIMRLLTCLTLYILHRTKNGPASTQLNGCKWVVSSAADFVIGADDEAKLTDFGQ
jgi:hypothetical protein